MRHRTGILENTISKILLIAAVAAGGFAQSFEVATVKPAQLPTPQQIVSGKAHIGMNVDARVDIGAMSLADLIRIAYKIKSYQISGPDWIKTERFDVLGKIPEGVSKDKVPEMLQALLAERFGLKFHRQPEEHSIYALVVAKGGPKLKESPPEEAPPAAAGEKSGMTIGTEKGPVNLQVDGSKGVVIRGGAAGTMRMTMVDGKMHMESSRLPMDALAEMLSRFVDRPVVDMTELKGNYQVALDLSMEDLRNIARSQGVNMPIGPVPGERTGDPADPEGGSIFQAVRQLGLKLEARKAPLDTLIIDHIEKTPTEN